jgi:hypothetical protein
MGKYKVYWKECANRHGGVESCWVKVDARGYVDASNGGSAIRLVKGALGREHLNKYKCRDFKADKK